MRPEDQSEFQRPHSTNVEPAPTGANLKNAARPENRRRAAAAKETESSSMGGLYFLFATASILFAGWFVGPRLVEEYHYAATRGKARAQYANAVEQLNGSPLYDVSHAYQMVAQKVRPSVVSVNAIKSRAENSGLGSGVIMSEQGYILTNAHVLEDAGRYYVELHDRRRYQAQLIGMDRISDLALLKIDAPGLIAADWGNSDDVEVGSIVWAVGSPYGFQQTVTSGILSGKDRPGDGRHGKQNLLQTDAAVNPGNSGGPLVDDQGRVIGINTSIFGETFQGISFAVPSATALFVYEQLKTAGKVTRGYLGVYPSEVDFSDAQRWDLPDLDGAKLQTVLFNSPAARAGIRPNDILRSWNDTPITDFRTLFRYAEMTPPNSTVDVTLIRNGTKQKVQVTVGELPATE